MRGTKGGGEGERKGNCMSQALPVRVYSPDHWAQPLDVPPGTRYVETDDRREIIESLSAGVGILSSSCGGNVFIWPDSSGGYLANHFFQGPPIRRHFDEPGEAAEFATSCLI